MYSLADSVRTTRPVDVEAALYVIRDFVGPRSFCASADEAMEYLESRPLPDERDGDWAEGEELAVELGLARELLERRASALVPTRDNALRCAALAYRTASALCAAVAAQAVLAPGTPLSGACGYDAAVSMWHETASAAADLFVSRADGLPIPEFDPGRVDALVRDSLRIARGALEKSGDYGDFQSMSSTHRTCRDLGAADSFECGECGCSLGLIAEADMGFVSTLVDVDGDGTSPSYCPVCGARVVR